MVECKEMVDLEPFEFEKEYEQDKREYLGMSSIGEECIRKLWYNFHMFPKNQIDSRIKSLFNLGHFIENEVVNALNEDGIEVFDQQKELSEYNGLFRGHIDGIIKNKAINNGETTLFECKSTNQKYFNYIKKNGFMNFFYFNKYMEQVQTYMYFLDIKKCIIFFYCKNDSKCAIQHIEYNKIYSQHCLYKAYIAIFSEEPPSKHYENDAKECSWCDHKIVCMNPESYIHSLKDRHCRNCLSYGMKKISCKYEHKSPFCIKHGIFLEGIKLCPNWKYRN